MKINLPSVVTSKFGRAGLVAHKNSPQLLFGAGIVLMGATVLSACKGTLDLYATLEEIQDDHTSIDRAKNKNPEKYTDKEIHRLHLYVNLKGGASVLKLYLPAMTLGVAAVACLTSSHNQLMRRNAGLSAALAATDRALRDYRRRVVDELGEDKDREFMFGKTEIEQETLDGNGKIKTKKVMVAAGASQYARLWGHGTSSEWTPNAPEYNIAKLRSVQERGTMLLNHRGHLFLNEIYDELGLERTPAGSQVGWLSKKYGGEDGFVDFGVLDPGKENRYIDFMQGHEDLILLDFNVDGEIWRLI